MSYDAVIFDLGNTLVSYYTRAQWPEVLAQCVAEASACLRERGLLRVDPDELARRVQAERRESGGIRVRPLEVRLAWIFGLSPAEMADDAGLAVCRCFMGPIFALASRYDDALPAIETLRRRGLETGILSNSPWGSPAALWREELARHGLLDAVDAAVFCGDVEWRKPARQPFEFIMQKLAVAPEHCLFVGDDPRWDIVGPSELGMDAVLIDRHGEFPDADAPRIRSLHELLDRVTP